MAALMHCACNPVELPSQLSKTVRACRLSMHACSSFSTCLYTSNMKLCCRNSLLAVVKKKLTFEYENYGIPPLMELPLFTLHHFLRRFQNLHKKFGLEPSLARCMLNLIIAPWWLTVHNWNFHAHVKSISRQLSKTHGKIAKKSFAPCKSWLNVVTHQLNTKKESLIL